MLLAFVPSVVPPHTIGLKLLSKPAIALALGAGKSARLTQDVFLDVKSITSADFVNPPSA
jgi:hypothetical protein